MGLRPHISMRQISLTSCTGQHRVRRNDLTGIQTPIKTITELKVLLPEWVCFTILPLGRFLSLPVVVTTKLEDIIDDLDIDTNKKLNWVGDTRSRVGLLPRTFHWEDSPLLPVLVSTNLKESTQQVYRYQ